MPAELLYDYEALNSGPVRVITQTEFFRSGLCGPFVQSCPSPVIKTQAGLTSVGWDREMKGKDEEAGKGKQVDGRRSEGWVAEASEAHLHVALSGNQAISAGHPRPSRSAPCARATHGVVKRRGWTAGTTRGGVGHLGLTHTETRRGRWWSTAERRCLSSENCQTTPATTSTTSVRQLLGTANAQTAPAATSTAPVHQRLGSANAETTPAGAQAAAGHLRASSWMIFSWMMWIIFLSGCLYLSLVIVCSSVRRSPVVVLRVLENFWG